MAAIACALAGLGVSSAQAHQDRLRTLHSFCSEANCADGSNPYTSNGLAMDSAGNLYGVNSYGGLHGGGVAYELFHVPGKDKWKYKVLYSFCALAGCTDGRPGYLQNLIIDSQGDLYGTTDNGGIADSGTVYELTPNRTGKYRILHTLYSFCSKDSGCTDGQDPISLTYRGAAAGVPYDGVSPLYGTTEFGGKHSGGVAFALSPGYRNWNEQLLHVFCQEAGCSDGAGPGALTFDPAGNLVGTAFVNNNRGMIFRLSRVVDQNRWVETTVYTFCALANCSDGNLPYGTPVIDANGNIFGAAAQGGTAPDCPYTNGCGVIYKIAADNTEAVLYNFCARKNCIDGSVPAGPLLMDASGNLYGTTAAGGQYTIIQRGGGTVFEWSASSLRTLRSFCAELYCPDGAEPESGVVMNSAEDLFGTTLYGGLQNLGTVFELKP